MVRMKLKKYPQIAPQIVTKYTCPGCGKKVNLRPCTVCPARVAAREKKESKPRKRREVNHVLSK